MSRPDKIIRCYPNVCHFMNKNIKNAFDAFGIALSTLKDSLRGDECDVERTANILMASSETLDEIDMNADEMVNSFLLCSQNIREIKEQLRAKDKKMKIMAKRSLNVSKKTRSNVY